MEPNYHAVLIGRDQLHNEILKKTLDGCIEVEQYTGETEFQCQSELKEPDLIIIHKTLAKGDGMIACESLRKENQFDHSSILMILENESVYQKIKCYEAGADDYIVEPYHPEEIIRKVKHLSKRSVQEKDQVVRTRTAKEQADSATKTAFEAMKATSDLGLILKFMESCQSSTDFEQLARELYKVTDGLGVTGVVQIHDEESEFTFSQRGTVRPIETQLLQEAKSKGRIVEDGSLIIVNFDLISLLIDDMPLNELDHGRLKDTLVQLIGAAEIRVRSIMVNDILHAQSRETISVINLIRQIAADNHKHATQIMKKLSEQIEISAVSLALTEEQEEHFVALSENAHIELDTLYRGSEILETHFMKVILGLQKAIDMHEGRR